ncbi:single insulin-like growth factor-binding domain protein-2 [Hyalella azteca]|uniref:Single insulin-like growth factor-binding domain protein-2 n=1 Tax=Hyalella azteca TaxID=294128 RepID=A0A8B7N3R1_HYAAZ|nr:single insulin-like growth factor-binding domain protein-2 [Hyalella azteca]
MFKAALILAVSLVLTWSAEGVICPPCVPAHLSPPENCSHGTTLDLCGCRLTCLKGLCERCGGPGNIHGRCRRSMNCIPSYPDGSGVCGHPGEVGPAVGCVLSQVDN